jgi:hypothetical protein
MKKKILINIAFLFLLLAVVFCSCKKFVAVELPPTQTTAEKVFSSDQTATSAVVGLYANLVFGLMTFCNGGMSLYPGLSADELYNTSPNEDADGFRTNTISPVNSNGAYQRTWTKAYTMIYQANAVVEGLENADKLSAGLQKQLKGEALVIRSFCYFYLVNLFGDVPLVLKTDYGENGGLARTKADEVKEQIKKDLLWAVENLAANYPSLGRARINKWAAAALLARVYLYNKEWANAEAQANAVIGSGLYSLADNLDNVFSATSNEAIWQLYSDVSNTAEGNAFIPSSETVRPAYAITDHLLNAFEPNDQRKTSWLKANTVSGQLYYYPFKYKIRAFTPVTEYLLVLRLAEQYLIRAEARAEQNKPIDAKDDLNLIRKRAGLDSTTASSRDEILSAIEHERQTELFAEWGHRWLDLKRRDRAHTVLSSLKAPTWQATDVLYPIPMQEILRNPALQQNEGY